MPSCQCFNKNLSFSSKGKKKEKQILVSPPTHLSFVSRLGIIINPSLMVCSEVTLLKKVPRI